MTIVVTADHATDYTAKISSLKSCRYIYFSALYTLYANSEVIIYVYSPTCCYLTLQTEPQLVVCLSVAASCMTIILETTKPFLLRTAYERQSNHCVINYSNY